MKKEFILFDTEYTCWEGSMARNWDKDFEHREIIQWSGLKINENLEIVDKFSFFVKPLINPILSNYCLELTGIQQDDIYSAKSFEEILTEFNKFSNNGKINKWSWGNDINVIIENCNLINKNIKYENNYYDLRKIFDKEMIDYGKSTSGELSSFFNIPSKGHIHNSDFDTLSLFLSVKNFGNRISKHLF